jgi:uncharacterized membrane protein YdjX (TVP38/TMEM64 family)
MLDPEARPDRRVALLRLGGFALLLATVFAVLTATGSTPSSADEVRDWGEDTGALGVLLFVPAFVLLNFVVAWPILVAAAGLLFGAGPGFPLALAGVTCAGLAQMGVSRLLAAGHHGNLLPKRTKRIEGFLERHGAIAVLESRLLPLLPFGVVNFSAGVTRMPFRALAIGTVIGASPKVFAYVALGGSLTDLRPRELVLFALTLLAIGALGVLILRRQIAADRAAGLT